MAARLCLEAGCTDIGNPRCSTHTQARQPSPRQRSQANRKRDEWRGSRQSRGYGAAHDRAARDLKARMVDGEACGRCGMPLYRWQLALPASDPNGIDAGHPDDQPASAGHLPSRLEHRGACNRRAAGQSRRHTPRG